jgi:hypothetical protein
MSKSNFKCRLTVAMIGMDPRWFGPWIRIWILIEVKRWIRIRLSIETHADPKHWLKYFLNMAYVISGMLLKLVLKSSTWICCSIRASALGSQFAFH